MAIEVTSSSSVVCSRCGLAYGRRKGYFLVNYGSLYKGTGHLDICKDCVDSIYNIYLAQCSDPRSAVRQVCRKLDMYWDDKIYDTVAKKSSPYTMMSTYIARINSTAYAGKSYDDTLIADGTMWTFGKELKQEKIEPVIEEAPKEPDVEIPDSVKDFWGSGYTNSMYAQLEKRRIYWMSKFPNNGENIDVGTEAIIRQICSLELDINRDRMAGKSVDKSVNALNTLLGSAALKPTQNKQEDLDSTILSIPFGVWIQKWEVGRPTPDIDDSLKDVDGIIKYILVWFFGHLCKMLGIKNSYSKLYEEEIARLRIERPQYDDESDEDMIYDIFSGSHDS